MNKRERRTKFEIKIKTPTGDVFGSLHDEDDGDQEREDLVGEAGEEENHVGKRKQAATPPKQAHGTRSVRTAQT